MILASLRPLLSGGLVGIAFCHSALALPTDWVLGDGSQIQSAIDAAQPGDRILLQPGEYRGGLDFRGKRLELIGLGGSAQTTILIPLVAIEGILLSGATAAGSVVRGISVQSEYDRGVLRMRDGADAALEDIRLLSLPGGTNGIYVTGACVQAVGIELDHVTAQFGLCASVNDLSASDSTISISGTSSGSEWALAGSFVTADGAGGLTGVVSTGGTLNFGSGPGQIFQVVGLEAVGSRVNFNCSGGGRLQDSSIDGEGLGNGGLLDVNLQFGSPGFLMEDCQIRNYQYTSGRAVRFLGDAPVEVLDCQFADLVYSAGGTSIVSAIVFQSLASVVVERCQFSLLNGRRYGAVLMQSIPAVTLRECDFVACSASAPSGYAQGGGALTVLDGDLVVEGGGFSACVVDYGDSPYGGAVCLDGAASASFDGVEFLGCTAAYGSAVALLSPVDEVVFDRCYLYGNSGAYLCYNPYGVSGHEISNSFLVGQSNTCYVEGFDLLQCTAAGNGNSDSLQLSGGGVAVNSIVYPGDISSSWSYCCGSSVAGGVGNLEANPLFVAPGSLDFNILPASPCVGAGDAGQDIGAAHAVGLEDCNGNGVSDGLDALLGDCDQDGIPDECQLSNSDCNGNGQVDYCDIAAGISTDCNGNGIPDECEFDCNGNGVPDDCDIASGFSLDLDDNGVPDDCKPDCDQDGIPDFVEITYGTQLDCNGNGVPDECDIAEGTSEDCNGNGIPDECDVLTGFSDDCDGNGVPDECDLLIYDCNENGVVDACDIASGFSIDLNGDGFPDECKPDCNLNGIPDYLDIAFGASFDCDGNGIPDECEEDCNGNGVVDGCDLQNGSPDCNGNGILDSCDLLAGDALDCNLNGIPDSCDFAAGVSFDCNGNGIPDECDIAAGTSLDVDGNGVPDECEGDCNGNGVVDAADIANGTSLDCNGNDVPDECELAAGTEQDCNTNGVLDSCEIAAGTSQDCNVNGIPDECEADCNGNGLDDTCDLVSGTSQDCNGNLEPDECDIASGLELDCNGNGVPDSCDLLAMTSLDCNANGVPDECDILGGVSLDCDGNGIPDECEADCNANGVVDACDISSGTSVDCNGNGIPDECELADGTAFDCNQNGVLDGCDLAAGTSLDCNANGVPDECEDDCNGNGLDDACDIASGSSADCNGNGVPDECELANGTDFDCNGNGILDACDFAAGTSLDCNGNGIPDECDIASGTSADCDANGIPDECTIAGNPNLDLNVNGVLDSCECQSSSYCTTSPNSVGSGALISYSGTAFVSFNDLTLIATGCPPSQFGIFFYGPNQISVANGNGTLCVGGLYRLPATLANGSGTAAYSLDLTAPPVPQAQIDAGETWNFQFWYRDLAAGGAGYNFTDGLSITFCP